jgi:GTP cyclohydrolase I
MNKQALEKLVESMLTQIGEDPTREGLVRTPHRVAKAMDFLTAGYRQSIEEAINGAVFESDNKEIVLVRDIDFYSMCEHHMLPFFGRAHVAYLPDGKIIGLSKLARIVDHFARRLQVQERLTSQVAACLDEVLQPKGVAVILRAQHLCMMMRGVEKQNSEAITSEMLGVFRDNPITRSELLSLVDLPARR